MGNKNQPNSIKATDIGKKGTGYFVLATCKQCGKTRYVQSVQPSGLCAKCGNYNKRLQIPNTKRPEELGRKGKAILFLDHCPVCHKEMWRAKQYVGAYCQRCAGSKHTPHMVGENNPRWKGGRSVSNGYTLVAISSDDPMAVMGLIRGKRSVRVFEHRLVMARYLGRPLEDWEVVHHKNSVRSDNRIENLELLPNRAENNAYTQLSERIKSLENEVAESNKLIRLLVFTVNHCHGNPEPSVNDSVDGVRRDYGHSTQHLGNDIVQSSEKSLGKLIM